MVSINNVRLVVAFVFVRLFVHGFLQDGFEEAQAQLEEAMKSQCYERIKLVKGIRKRVLVRIYFDDKRNIFTQVGGTSLIAVASFIELESLSR